MNENTTQPAASMSLAPVNEVKKVETWDVLASELFVDSHNTKLDRHRSPYAFRGQGGDFPLTPGVMRLKHDPSEVSRIERRLFGSFKKYAHQTVRPDFSEWDWLVLAQHYGLPTRLLDWTYSPFVALHFMTCNLAQMDCDGVVWCANLFEVQQFLHPDLRGLLKDGVATFTAGDLSKQYENFQKFDASDEETDFVLFFEPPSLDQRIVNQVALFSFMSRPTAQLDDWLRGKAQGCPKIYRKITVSKDLKWEIRDKLDQLNLTERVLFPGLDGLSQWLKRWYTPRHPFSA
jgi:FRG domain